MDDNGIACLWECGKIRRRRGLCDNCDKKRRKMVADGKTTNEKLIAQGKLLPVSQANIRRSNANLFIKRS